MFSAVRHLFILLAFACLTPAAAQAERIRTSIPGLNLNYLSVLTVGAKGFFKDEGLENETIVIGGPAGSAALVKGGVDFSVSGGQRLRAGAQGAALKAFMYQREKPIRYVVIHASIT